jgi:cytochrome c oxidase subunit 4
MSTTGPTTRDESTGPVVETSPEEGGTHHDHPGEAKYIKIALILAVITGIEVAFSYIEAVEGILAPSLIFMSIIKFVMVVAFFMHLRFDSRLFRRLFVAGVALALFCYTVMLTTFHVWTR